LALGFCLFEHAASALEAPRQGTNKVAPKAPIRSLELITRAQEVAQKTRDCQTQLKEAVLPKLNAITTSEAAVQQAWSAWLAEFASRP
jgi:hypothetical protein